MTYGNYKGIDDSIETQDFSESQTPGASTSLKGVFFVDRYTNVMLIFLFLDIIATFGLETILIYTAVLLRKRVVVYHHNISILLKVV
jgi:hypothetical protein